MAIIGQDIAYAQQLLENGDVVAVPTETVYGLAGNALNDRAVTKIFTVKDRPYFDPLIVHVTSADEVKKYAAATPHEADLLMKKFWPGPLTLLLPKKEIIPDLVTSGLDRVGIRCPDHPLTHQLLKNLSFPLAAPSANPFGYVSPTTAEHVNDQLGKKISYILDGGPSMVGIESTIVGWEGGIPVIYRMGGISQEMIESVIGKVATLAQSTSQPQAPGQLASHYAPKKKFLLGHLETLAKENAPARLGILAFQKGIETNGRATQLILSPIGNLEEAARNLFSMLRQLDTHDIDMVIAEEVPNIGLGRAINDRLRRAAASYPQISQIK